MAASRIAPARGNRAARQAAQERRRGALRGSRIAPRAKTFTAGGARTGAISGLAEGRVAASVSGGSSSGS